MHADRRQITAPVAGPAVDLAPGRLPGRTLEALAKVSGDHAEIMIYSTIGESFWGDTVDAKTLVAELADLDVATITLRINSPGGSVTDGWAIATALKRHRATVTATVDGLCGSIATVIALAADRVVMAQGTLFMIHNPSGVSIGEASEHRKTAEILDTMREQLLEVYVAASTKTEEEIGAALDEETWLKPADALAWGFCDEVLDGEEVDVAATAHYDASVFDTFRHPPASIVERLIAAGPLPTRARQAPVPSTDTDETDAPGKVLANEIVQVDERALARLL